MPVRIVYAGTPVFAVPALQALLDNNYEIAAVYTQPDRPAGRGRHLQASPIKVLAEKHSLPIEQPLNFKSNETVKRLASYRPDLMIVAAYGLILPPSVLTVPRLGCINIHASLLPRWRGAAPIQRAILAGDRETGITLMQMDAGLDTGPMLMQRSIDIHRNDSAEVVHDRLATLGAELLIETLPAIIAGALTPQTQDNAQASYAAKLDKAEALIDWRLDAATLERRVNAFNPWPVAYSLLADKTLRIWRASAIDETTRVTPGTVLRCDSNGVDVATGDGVLRLLELQLPGGRVLPVRDFVNAHNLLGQKLG
jgi:methionyl-tRNA formyltransferase